MLSGESANLLSMGAIDFGIIVDATVIMVENIFRHLAEASHKTGPQRRAPDGLTGKLATIFNASTEVTKAIFFSATIIIAGFLPLFTLSGVEGHIFGPMARTYAYALLGGLIATFTVSPALAALLLPEQGRRMPRPARCARLRRGYARLRDLALASRRATRRRRPRRCWCWPALAGSTIGLEFLPKLEEGNMWIRAVMPASISLEAGNDYANRMRKLIKSFPEAETVISQHGRPDDGTDSDGLLQRRVLRAAEARWTAGARASTRTA